LDDPLLPPRAYGLVPWPYVYLDMGAQVFLLFDVGVVLSTLPEDEVAWFHLFEGYVCLQGIHLLCLVPWSKCEPKVFTQVVYHLAGESTAI